MKKTRSNNFLFLVLFLQLSFLSAQSTADKIRTFYIPESLSPEQSTRIRSLHKLIAAERLFQTREELLRSLDPDQNSLKEKLHAVQTKDFISYFETRPLEAATSPETLREALDQLVDQVNNADIEVPNDTPRNFLLNKILGMGLNFEAPLVKEAAKNLPTVPAEANQLNSHFRTPNYQWNQNLAKFIINPAERKPLLDHEYYLSKNQGLSPFWAVHLKMVDNLDLQRGTPNSLLYLFKDLVPTQVLARLDTIDANYNPIYLTSMKVGDEEKLSYVISEVGGEDREQHFIAAWSLASDSLAQDESAKLDLSEALTQQVRSVNTIDRDGGWYSVLSKLLSSSANALIPETWLIGQLGLFDRYFSREENRLALRAALADAAITWETLSAQHSLSSAQTQKLQALLEESNVEEELVQDLLGDTGSLLNKIASDKETASVLQKYTRPFRIEKRDLRTYHWALYEYKDAQGKLRRLRAFENCWGDELGNIMSFSSQYASRVLFLGTAGAIPGTSELKRGDIVVPSQFKKISWQNWNPAVDPQIYVDVRKFAQLEMPQLKAKYVNSITSVSSPFLENEAWLNLHKEHNVELVDVESEALSSYSYDRSRISALYFVSDVVGDDTQSLSEDSSSERSDARNHAAAQILLSVEAVAPAQPETRSLSASEILQQALNKKLPAKAGAIDRHKILSVLLPRAELQKEDSLLNPEWLEQEISKILTTHQWVNDAAYEKVSLQLARELISLREQLSLADTYGFQFMITSKFTNFKLSPEDRIPVKLCLYSYDENSRELIDRARVAMSATLTQVALWELSETEDCTQLYNKKYEAYSAHSLWELSRRFRDTLYQKSGFIYLSEADGGEKFIQPQIPTPTLFGAWIESGQESPFTQLFSINNEEKSLLEKIGPVPHVYQQLLELQNSLNSRSGFGEEEIGVFNPTPQTVPAVAFRVERVNQGVKAWRFVAGKDPVKGLFVSLQLSPPTEWTFDFVEVHALLTRIALSQGLNSGELLELILNAEQGSSSAQYFLAAEYEASLQDIKSQLANYISLLDTDRVDAANAFIDLRLKRIGTHKEKIIESHKKQKAFRKRIGEIRKLHLRQLEEQRSAIAHSGDPNAVNDLLPFEPVELAKQGKRQELVRLFEANLPWEDFEPTELRYWKRMLTLMKQPLAFEQRQLFFRGLSGDAKQGMIKKTADGGHVLLPVGWARGQGSWLFRLRYLKNFYSKLSVNFFQGGNDEWRKDLRLLNSAGTWHSGDPKGSPFLSTSNYPVARGFSIEYDSNGQLVDNPTALVAVLSDPRMNLPNFVSSFTSEYEHLLSLVVFPDEILHMFSAPEVASFLHEGEQINFPAVQNLLQQKLNERGITKQLSEQDLKYSPDPAHMADNWWSLLSETEKLSYEDFAKALMSGIPEALTQDLEAVVHTPVTKD